MRGRGEGEDSYELTGSITKASQKSLVGLALWRNRREELEFSVLWKERSEAFSILCSREQKKGKGALV